MTTGSISPPHISPLRVGHSSKSSIDTNTLIEIRCTTHDVDIYYTLDGSKPDSFITLTNRRSTIEYRKPFYIPRELATAGRVTVQAIAVSRNGIKESKVVREAFNIKLAASDHVPADEYENRYLHQLQQERQELIQRLQHEQKSPELLHRQTAETFQPVNSSHHSSRDSRRQIDVLRCAHCFAPKQQDSFTRFCTECGLPWQKLTQTPPIHPSSNTCAHCQSTIPFESDTCVVCGTPASIEYSQRRPAIQNQTKILCPQCKSANPTHLRICYACESILLPTPTPKIRASVSVPSASKMTNTQVKCSNCFQLNNSNAHFCNWCGVQVERMPLPAQCAQCRTSNDPRAKFCSTCGCVIQSFVQVVDTRLTNHSNIPASAMIASTLTRQSTSPSWLNANTAVIPYHQSHSRTRGEAATQTYGIYYPGAKDLDQVIKQNKQILADREMKEQQPVLTAVSPGNGYWKKQVDHICAHLKTYAVNQPDFRSLIGEPRMGKMVHATIHENDHQITFQAVFHKPENLSHPSTFTDHPREHYRATIERSSPFSSAFNSDEEYIREKPRRAKAKKHPTKQRSTSAESDPTDSPTHDLIKLMEKKIGDHKRSSHRLNVPDEVKRLIREKNANANAKDRAGYTILQLAVKNGHDDCLDILIKDGGAKLDKPGLQGNTALHECCLLGSDGIEPLKILLKHGGNVAWLNDRKESVTDIANKHNCQELIRVLATHRGDQMMRQSTKDHPRSKTTNGHWSSEKH